MNPWKSNLILSEIPWSYYLHPCPKFYAEELSLQGPTIWVDPPTRNPAKLRLFRPNPKLLVLRPWFFKRSADNLGFDRPEVRLQVKVISSLFLKSPSSVWSISTAYEHLLMDYSPEVSLFWSGDFFDPEGEFTTYENFDILLCLTPVTFEGTPSKFTGKKVPFNMCCDLKLFQREEKQTPTSIVHALADRPKDAPVAGYVGTLSDRRIDYDLLSETAEKLPQVSFLLVGKDDGAQSTSERLDKVGRLPNVRIVMDLDYPDMPATIRSFDVCLIPYHTNDANLGTCPTKFVEYCAVGKPIVSTQLPGIAKFPKLVGLAGSSDEFVRLIELQSQNRDETLFRQQRSFALDSSPSRFLERFITTLQTNDVTNS